MRNQAGPKLFFTPPALARMLGVSLEVVKDWFDSGELQGFRTPGRRRRVHRDEAASLLRAKGFDIPPELFGDG